MDTVPDRISKHRFPVWLAIVLASSFAFVVSIPLVAGDGAPFVEASIYLSRTEASPGEQVTFWIWIDPLKEPARRLVVTEAELDGFANLSSVAPDSCLETRRTWVCIQDDLASFAIEVRAVVEYGTEGRELVYAADVAVWDKKDDDDDDGDEDDEDEGDDDDDSDPRSTWANAKVKILPAREVDRSEPDIEVRLSAAQSTVAPGDPMTYRVDVTNQGTAPAHNVSVVVDVPPAIVLLSASPWPSKQGSRLTWTLDAVPVGSIQLTFNATLPASSPLDQVDASVAVTYGDGNGGQVRVETMPSSVGVVPLAAPTLSPVPIGIALAVIAFVARFVFLPPGPVGSFLPKGSGADEIFLLHRSGVLLKHLSSNRTREMDSDILGGMLAAVRMFVEDSMDPNAGPLQEIRFGGGSIVFVAGQNATVAAVNARGNRIRFAERATGFLRQFETLNGDALANFDGLATPLEGVDDLMSRVGS